MKGLKNWGAVCFSVVMLTSSPVQAADRKADALDKADKLIQKLNSDIQSYSKKKVRRVIGALNDLETVMNSRGGGNGGGGRGPKAGSLSIDNGYLEVFLNGQWKGVCDDSFDASDAEVACRQMGGTYVSYSTGISGPSDDFWLDDLSCRGDEQFLSQCSHSGVGSENCGSSEHVQVVCNGLPTSGRARRSIRNTTVLEVKHDGVWKPVCDDSFDQNDAEVACRQMGMTYVRHSIGVNASTDDFWMDDLSCSGSESSLFQCSHNGLGNENCGSSEGVQVICH